MQDSGLCWAALGRFLDLSESWTYPSLPLSSSFPTSSYIGDCEISVELQKIQAGVNGIQVGGGWCDYLQGWSQGTGSGVRLEEAAVGVMTPGTEADTNQGTPGLRSQTRNWWLGFIAPLLRTAPSCRCWWNPPAREASMTPGSERLFTDTERVLRNPGRWRRQSLWQEWRS